MRHGAWHQCGDKSQKLVAEQLSQGAGVGVVVSPRDVSWSKAQEYAEQYQGSGAEILIDQQFYLPGFSNKNLESYSISQYRDSMSQLQRISDHDLAGLANELRQIHSGLSASAIIAPAIMYEAGRADIFPLNARLFNAAKQVGDELGIPTYATVAIGRSATVSDPTTEAVLSQATSLNGDGWYFIFEFDADRLPSNTNEVFRCCSSGLSLACSGKPVLHGYAGPMALLSMGFGATGTAIGHSQNTWQFSRSRWEPSDGSGGGGDAPARFFSRSLWGTIVYPDEIRDLSSGHQTEVFTPSSFSPQRISTPLERLDRWNANKHLVNIICDTVSGIAADNDPRVCARAAIAILQNAVRLHGDIAGAGMILKDNTNVYQNNWQEAMQKLLDERTRDFDYLALIQ